jgi:Glutathione S-transferase, N-terminal domain
MIDLFYWTTPNGHKIALFLQFKPEFLAISPNNRIPAIVDQDPGDGGAPVSVFESGAILLYLAEKTGKFLPEDLRGRVAALEWLFWHWPNGRPEPSFQTICAREARLCDRTLCERNQPPLRKRLADRAFVAGEYSTPIWRPILGSSPTKTKARSLRIFRISNAGSRRSMRVPRRSAPMPERRKSILRRSPSMTSRAKSYSPRRQRM